MNKLNEKIEKAIKLIKICKPENDIYEVAYSGGKDSDVILKLTQMAGVPYRAIYRNTTIDPPQTIEHAKANGVEVIYPKRNFFQMIEKKGIPSRWARFCCSEFKEYKILDNVIIGIRKAESRARAERYKEPVICRIYNKKERVNQILPILDWTDADVENFINTYKIQCHELYYKNGVFDVKRRLGCIGCPIMSTKKRVEDFKKYNGILKKEIKALEVYHQTHKLNDYFSNVYEKMFFCIYFNNVVEFSIWKHGLFGDVDCKKLLEINFNIEF